MERLNDLFFSSKASEGLTYEQILSDVQRFVTQNHADTLSSEGNQEEARKLLKDYILQYVQNRSYHVDGQSTEELVDSLYEDMAGISFLKKWIYKPGVEEVNINPLYQFDVTDNITDTSGNITVVGSHKKLGGISDNLKRRMLDNGVPAGKIKPFLSNQEGGN